MPKRLLSWRGVAMPRFVAYGKKNGKPVKAIYDNGKLICDSKEVVDEIMKFIDEVRTWETPMRFAKFRMWKIRRAPVHVQICH